MSKTVSKQELEELVHDFHPQKLDFHQSRSSENLWVRDDSDFYFMDTGSTWRLFKMIEGEAKPKKELLKGGINKQMLQDLLSVMEFSIE